MTMFFQGPLRMMEALNILPTFGAKAYLFPEAPKEFCYSHHILLGTKEKSIDKNEITFLIRNNFIITLIWVDTISK